MKKLISFILVFSLIFSATIVYGADIGVIVNDHKLIFDVPPTVENGRTLVPLRAIFEALGATVNWDGETQSAKAQKDNTNVKLTLGSDIMYVNGVEKHLDVPAKAIEGRTLVPVRAISEAFGCDVAWNQVLGIVHISEELSFADLGTGEYLSNSYSIVDGNKPYFNIDNYTSQAFEMYLPLDSLGRCTYAMAMLGKETLPAGGRESISSVTPSGWRSITYSNVPGQYLYNRCHLIGYQLSAENANECNLITGTRFLNVEGMLPFENMIADYIEETGNHVLYRVTPVFEGNNLVAKGVLMEAMSFEDKGREICFNVFCYNVQPGIVINYADGTSYSPTGTLIKDYTAESENITYVLNTKSLKFHIPTCSTVSKMSQANREDSNLSRDEVIAKGYVPCGVCKL